MKQCLNCGQKFEPKNPKGVYCSDKCRVSVNRKKMGAKGNTHTDVQVDEAPKITLENKRVDKETLSKAANSKKPFMSEAIRKKLGL